MILSWTSTSSHLPVLVLWLKRHQGAIFTAWQDVLWGGAVDLLQLIAFLLPLTTICSWNQNKKSESLQITCTQLHSGVTITAHQNVAES